MSPKKVQEVETRMVQGRRRGAEHEVEGGDEDGRREAERARNKDEDDEKAGSKNNAKQNANVETTRSHTRSGGKGDDNEGHREAELEGREGVGETSAYDGSDTTKES